MKATICDCCHKVISTDYSSDRFSYLVMLEKDSKDGTRSLDFCENCVDTILDEVRKNIKEVQKGAKIF